jgi:Icc-related predicted phosphoesterase
MKLLVFSDIHNDWAALKRLMEIEADYYFAAGDLVTWSRDLDACGRILSRRAERLYYLPGNHESADVISALARKYGLHFFHGQHFQVEGHHIAGLGYSNPTPFNTPGEYTEEGLSRRLAAFAELNPLVLVCHCPPLRTPLDQVRPGVHAGSRAVREFIEQHQPEYFFCGHIHEAEGATAELGCTRGFNTGKRGYLLEL